MYKDVRKEEPIIDQPFLAYAKDVDGSYLWLIMVKIYIDNQQNTCYVSQDEYYREYEFTYWIELPPPPTEEK